jgi:hypothetical protein
VYVAKVTGAFRDQEHAPENEETKYEGESKIIRNVATYCAVGYTAGWA